MLQYLPQLVLLYIICYLVGILCIKFFLPYLTGVSIGAISFRSLHRINITAPDGTCLAHIRLVRLQFKMPTEGNWKWWRLLVEEITIYAPFPFPKPAKRTEATPKPLKPPKTPRQNIKATLNEKKVIFIYKIICYIANNFEVCLDDIALVLGDGILVSQLEYLKVRLVLAAPEKKRKVVRFPVAVDVDLGAFSLNVSDDIPTPILRIPDWGFLTKFCVNLKESKADRVEFDFKVGHVGVDASQIFVLVKKLENAIASYENGGKNEDVGKEADLFAENFADDFDTDLSNFFNEPFSESDVEPSRCPSPAAGSSSLAKKAMTKQFLQQSRSSSPLLAPTVIVPNTPKVTEEGLVNKKADSPFDVIKLLRRARFRIRRIQCDFGLYFDDEKYFLSEDPIPPSASFTVNEITIAARGSGSHKSSVNLEAKIGRMYLCITSVPDYSNEIKLANLERISISSRFNPIGALEGEFKSLLVFENPEFFIKMEDITVMKKLRIPEESLPPVGAKKQELSINLIPEEPNSEDELLSINSEITLKIESPKFICTLGKGQSQLSLSLEMRLIQLTSMMRIVQDFPLEFNIHMDATHFEAVLNLQSKRNILAGIGSLEATIEKLAFRGVDVYGYTDLVVSDICITPDAEVICLFMEKIPLDVSGHDLDFLDLRDEAVPVPIDAAIKLPLGLTLPFLTVRVTINNFTVCISGQGDSCDSETRGIKFGIDYIHAARVSEKDCQQYYDTKFGEFQAGKCVMEIREVFLNQINCETSIFSSSGLMAFADLSHPSQVQLQIGLEEINVGVNVCAFYYILTAVRQIVQIVDKASLSFKSKPAYKSQPPATSSISLQILTDIQSVTVTLSLTDGIKAWLSVSTVSSNFDGKTVSARVESVEFSGMHPEAKGEKVGILALSEVNVSKSIAALDGVIEVSLEMLHVTQPDKFDLSDIFEHLNNMSKAIKWAASRILDGCDPPYSKSHILLPKISATIEEMLVELDDNDFEVALSRNYRVGLKEQKERLSRWDALETKLQGLSNTNTGSESAAKNPATAYNALRTYDSNSWIRRINRVKAKRTKATPLLCVKGQKVHIEISQPVFGLNGAPQIIHEIDGTTPLDFEFDLLIPMHFKLMAGGLSLWLRDYPFPFIRFPTLEEIDGYRSSFSAEGDLIVQEQKPQYFAFRHVDVFICNGVVAKIARTISPVKVYSNAKLKASSDAPTEFNWGNSLLPVLQEMGHAFRRFSVPNPDISPQLGFWDKIPLALHGKLKLEWPEAGELKVRLRGGLDPYVDNEVNNGCELVCRGVTVMLGENKSVLSLKTSELLFGIPGDPEKGEDMEKVLFRSTGGIHIGVGVAFSRKDGNPCQPHHMVCTRVAEFSEKGHDSFQLYRSDYIHLNLLIEFIGGAYCRNSLHLTTRLITRLQRIFADKPPPPVRTGSMYPMLEGPGPNIQRHLKSARIQFLLSPLAAAFIYRNPHIGTRVEETYLAGIKAMIQSINADIIIGLKERATEDVKTDAELYLEDALVDIVELDARVIGSRAGLNLIPSEENMNDLESIVSTESKPEWLNDDDYSELEMETISGELEDIRVEPLLWAPRFAYFSQNQEKSGYYKQEYQKGKDIFSVQCDLFRLRKKEIEDDIAELAKKLTKLQNSFQDLRFSEEFRREVKNSKDHIEALKRKSQMLDRHIKDTWLSGEHSHSKSFGKRVDSFPHQVVLHNANIIWSIPVRNGIMRLAMYLEHYQAMQYYMSTSAVKVLRKLNFERDEQQEMVEASSNEPDDSVYKEDPKSVEDMIKRLTEDSDDERANDSGNEDAQVLESVSNILVQLINTQVRFQTRLDAPSMMYLVAEKIELQALSIIDPQFIGDPTNQLVKSRFQLNIKDLQLFLAFKERLESAYFGYSTFDYGTKKNEAWPVWVPLEVLVDRSEDPGLFECLIQRTVADAFFEKNNSFRIARNTKKKYLGLDEEAYEADARADHLSLHLPKFRMHVNSDQFAELQTIIMDLLVYQEPAEKERLEQIKSVVISANSGDFGNVAETVYGLQEKIRTLKEVERQYEDQINTLTDQQIVDYNAVADQTADIRNYLYLVMEGITRSFQSGKNKDVQNSIKATMLTEQINWRMLMDSGDSLCEANLQGVNLTWVINEDGSSVNSLEIDQLFINNCLQNTAFPEMLYPYAEDPSRAIDFRRRKMIRVYWRQLAPVAGIQVIEHFEINIFPLLLQLTNRIGKEFITYLFPEKRKAKAAKEAEKQLDSRKSRKSSALEPPDSFLAARRPSFSAEAVSTFDGKSIAPSMSSRATTNIKVNASVSKMQWRASQNRTFIYIKVPSISLNLSYKGAKEKNIEDIYGFLFTLPTFEYRNKTWTTLDLIEQIKKDMISIVLSHTGALLKEKFFSNQRGKNVHAAVAVDHSQDISDVEGNESDVSTIGETQAPQERKKSILTSFKKTATTRDYTKTGLLSNEDKIRLLFGDLYKLIEIHDPEKRCGECASCLLKRDESIQ